MNRTKHKPEPMNFRREALAIRRARIDALLETIRENRPRWAALAPWQAEKILEPKQQQFQFDNPRPH